MLRIPVPTDEGNELAQNSSLMADKITTMRRSDLRERLGRLEDEVMLRLSRALAVLSGIAS
ncbi:type II toxin-antitoxin system PemK/MazF family toxin [Bounagaea algeriensis]